VPQQRLPDAGDGLVGERAGGVGAGDLGADVSGQW